MRQAGFLYVVKVRMVASVHNYDSERIGLGKGKIDIITGLWSGTGLAKRSGNNARASYAIASLKSEEKYTMNTNQESRKLLISKTHATPDQTSWPTFTSISGML